MTLRKRAKDFGKKAAKVRRKADLAQLWESERAFVKGKNNRGGYYSTHTIVDHSSTCKRELRLAGASDRVSRWADEIILSGEDRSKKRELDTSSLSVFTDGQQLITISQPAALIAQAVDSALNSWHVKELVIALGLLTGRRMGEVVQIAASNAFQFVDDKHMKLGKLSKGTIKEAVVPVFGSSATVIKGFQNLASVLPEDIVDGCKREDLSEDEQTQLNKTINSRFSSAASKYAKDYLEGFYSVEKRGEVKKDWQPNAHAMRKIYTALAQKFVERKSEIVPQVGGKFVTTILAHATQKADAHYDFFEIENSDNYAW